MTANAQVASDTLGQQALELFNAKQYAAAKDQATAGTASGSVVSMYVLGEIYASGKGEAQDYSEAASWFRKAADAGYAPAMNAMGGAHETGHGVEENLALAVGWYRRSADKGDGAGMNSLGHLFEIGGGVPKDYVQAFQWYLKGAGAGAPAAMVSLGLMYENGHAVNPAGQPTLQDFGEALKWYEKAAKEGGGMYRLALSYDIGKGTAPNRPLAMEWYRKAADAGSELARARLGNDTSGSQAGGASPVPSPTGSDTSGSNGVNRAGNRMTQPTKLTGQGLDPTEVAKKLRVRGEVDVSVVVQVDGTVRDHPKVVRPIGYGLDDRAIEASRKWRFNPGTKDGNPAAIAVQIGFVVSLPGPTGPDIWHSGPLAFAQEDGVTPPDVKDGTLPKPGGAIANESAILEFIVDMSGAVKDIKPIQGSQSASELLTQSLSTWKFRPAMKGSRPVEAVGRVRFAKGQDERANYPVAAPLPQRNPSEPDTAPSTAGAILTPLDPAAVDDTYVSTNSPTAALIDFVNRSGRAVDIYWINYQGKRQLLTAGLAAGATFSEGTYLTHPWLVVVSGTGGATARDTGTRLAGFVAVTPNGTRDRAKRDIAIIKSPEKANAPGAQVGACVAPPPGLVGWWPGDDSENDIAGGHNPSADHTVSIVPGEVRSGFRFGNQGGIQIPASPNLENQQFTWMAWARPDGPGPNNDKDGSVIVSQYIDGRSAPSNLQWRATDNRFLFFFGDIASERIESAHTFSPGAFYLVAGTYDGSTFRLFVNGAMVGSTARRKTVLYSSFPWMFGSTGIECSAFCRTWNGVIDEVQAYNRALSEMEIQSIFHAGSAGVCKSAAANDADSRSVPNAPAPSTAASSPTVNAGQIRTMVNKKDVQVYVWIPPGAFTMGCSEGDTECGDNEKPPHTERIENGFWLGQTEVTQAAYQRVTGRNPSAHKGDQLPVESVTWNDAANYCTAIGGRLPSEAEWEYAARAGVTWARYGNLDAVAWHSSNSGGTSHPVAIKQGNAFGLYDMLGNVWEWVEGSYPGSSDKIMRGGSWYVSSLNARASTRGRSAASGSTNARGIRCAGEWPEPEKTPLGGSSIAPIPVLVAPGTPGPDGVYRAGNGVSQPKLLRHVDVEYSEAARKAKVEGVVVLQIVIDAKGDIVNPTVIKRLGFGLDEKAIEAVRKWKFDPGRKDGKPVPVASTVEVNFRLQ
jgi:TonB family protein